MPSPGSDQTSSDRREDDLDLDHDHDLSVEINLTSDAPIIDLRGQRWPYRGNVRQIETPVGLVPDLRAPSSRTAPRGRLAQWMASLDLQTWRATRRLLVLVALMPLTLLAATRIHLLTDSVILATYGILVILGTCFIMYRAFVVYRDPAFDAPLVPADQQELVSMIIPVKNEERIIEACVTSVLGGTYRNLEVLVVDDGSTDRTREILESIDDPRLTLHTFDESQGKKRACTHAARHAQGSIIAFTDSDCVLASDALELCVRALQVNPRFGAVSGHGRALNANRNLLTRVQDVWYDSQFAVTKAAEATYGTVTCVSGPMAVYRREAVINYLPAWAADRFAGAEFLFATDRQLTASVLGQEHVGERLKADHLDDPLVKDEDHEPERWEIGYVRSARVWTEVPERSRAFLRQQVRWKKSFIRNSFFNGPWMWRRGVGAAVLYYGHALWVLAAPFMAFRHLVWMPLQGAWELTILYLCGILVKGFVWAGAYRVHNPHCDRWIYRPLMSLVSTLGLSWLIIYSAATVRRRVWARG